MTTEIRCQIESLSLDWFLWRSFTSPRKCVNRKLASALTTHNLSIVNVFSAAIDAAQSVICYSLLLLFPHVLQNLEEAERGFIETLLRF